MNEVQNQSDLEYRLDLDDDQVNNTDYYQNQENDNHYNQKQGQNMSPIQDYQQNYPAQQAPFDPLGIIYKSNLADQSSDSRHTNNLQIITTKDDWKDNDENEIKKQSHQQEFVNCIQNLTIEVPSFQEKKIDNGKNNVIFYRIIVGFQKNNKRWFLDKRYSEFDAMDKTLREWYPNITPLPGKTLFKLSQQKAIEDRQKALNDYMKALINRRDMRTCNTFRKFIDLDNHFQASQKFDAKKIGSMIDLPQGVRDFIYLPQYQSMIVAMSDMNIATRIDSYFTNITLPWEKSVKNKPAQSVLKEEAVSTVGAIQHYIINENQDSDFCSLDNQNNVWKYSQSWGRTFGSQTNILHWVDEKSVLFLGLDSGSIHRFKLAKEKNLRIMIELPEITVHNTQQRIMGLSVDPRVNYLYSISESGYLIVTDLNDTKVDGGKFLNSQNLSIKSGLKAMIHDIQRNILFIASGCGQIFILNCLKQMPEIITTLYTDQKVCIRGLTRSFNLNEFWKLNNQGPAFQNGVNQNLLLASDVNGYITIFDIGNQGKEKLAKRIGNTQGKSMQRVVVWRDQGREIISGDEQGCVTFWYSKEGNPLYVLKAHTGAITQMRFNEERQQLITCSKDKSIKVWQLPGRWIDENLLGRLQNEQLEKSPIEHKTIHESGISESIWSPIIIDKINISKTLIKEEKKTSENSFQSKKSIKNITNILSSDYEQIDKVNEENDQILTEAKLVKEESDDDEDLYGWNK